MNALFMQALNIYFYQTPRINIISNSRQTALNIICKSVKVIVEKGFENLLYLHCTDQRFSKKDQV